MSILLYGGRVIDPARQVDGKLNLLLDDGVIAGISTGDLRADEKIDVTGKVVCPGFIDCHVHEDALDGSGRIYADPDKSVFSCMLRMGVTTVVCGNCGENVCDPVRYLDIVDRDGAWVNVAMLAGHGFFRRQAGAADPYAPADERQIERMTVQMERALLDGCVGTSYGIRYTPGMSDDELRCTLSAGEYMDRPAACHLRDDARGVFDALRQFVSAAEDYDLPMQISHVGSMAGFGQMERFLDTVNLLRAGSTTITCDCYPYSAFSTGLGSATYDDGWLERYGCDYSALELCEGEYKGRRCTEEIFRKARRDFPACRTVCHVMRPEEVDRALVHPAVMIASDATLHLGQGHPRAAGTFPRIFAQYVRTGRMSLYDAIAKMTAMPARRFHLTGKGTLCFFSDADITVFDPEKIADRATFDDPIAPPVGIDYVFIGGKMAVKDGRIVSPALGCSVRAQGPDID